MKYWQYHLRTRIYLGISRIRCNQVFSVIHYRYMYVCMLYVLCRASFSKAGLWRGNQWCNYLLSCYAMQESISYILNYTSVSVYYVHCIYSCIHCRWQLYHHFRCPWSHLMWYPQSFGSCPILFARRKHLKNGICLKCLFFYNFSSVLL